MPLAVAAWLVLCLIWGSTWLFIKLGLADLPPISFAGIRFVVAASVLWVIVAIRRSPLPREPRVWGYLALTGFLSFSVNYGLIFCGEARTSSGLAAVLQAHDSGFRPRRRPPSPAGRPLDAAEGARRRARDRGRGGAFAVALSNVLVKARGASFDPVILSAVQMTFGLVPLVAAGLVLEGSPLAFRWTPLAMVSLLYLALVGSVVAFLLFYWLLRRMDVTNVLLIALVTPVLAVALGAAVLNEHLGVRAFLGTALIFGGVFLGLRGRVAPYRFFSNQSARR